MELIKKKRKRKTPNESFVNIVFVLIKEYSESLLLNPGILDLVTPTPYIYCL